MNGYDLIIPVYNEKKIIKLLDYLFISSNLITKIYICYDNDKDITVQFIKNSKYFNFSKVILLKNLAMGPCEAVKTGIYKSNSSAIIVYPADDFNNGTLLDQMYQEFKNGYDIVCPSRFMSGGVIKNCPLLKYLIVRTVSFFYIIYQT